MKYNGWTNKETWLVNLWLGDIFQCDQKDGFEISPEYVQEMVDEMASAALESDANGLITDLLNCALGEINYFEIASFYTKEES